MESAAFTLFLVFFALLLVGTPLAVCLGLSVMATFWWHESLPLMAAAQKLYNGLDHFPLMAIPFFVLASNIMTTGGVSKRLIDLCNAFVGHFRGGLAVASVVSCMFFAAISGSSPSTVVAIGSIMIPAMIASGYGARYSVGLLGSAGSLGILIPPSIPMIVYGVATEQSVGKLFMAGVGPGIFMGLVFIITAIIVAQVKGFKGTTAVSWSTRMRLFWQALPGLFMPFLVLGGIYGGVFTPTEAAAVAVVYSLIVGLFIYRDLTFRDLPKVFIRSAVVMSMLLFIITNAMLFAFILTTEGIASSVAQFIVSHAVSPWAFPALCQHSALFCGRFHGAQRRHIDPGPLVSAHCPGTGHRSHSLRGYHDGQYGDRDDHAAGGPESFRGQRHIGIESVGCFQGSGPVHDNHAHRAFDHHLRSGHFSLVPQTHLRQPVLGRPVSGDINDIKTTAGGEDPPINIGGLDHLVLTVGDISRTCRFYTGVLGMKEISHDRDRKALAFGNQKINLHAAGSRIEPRAASPTPGSADLCLVTETPLARVIEALEKNGVEVIAGPVPRTGARGRMMSVYFRDPDGNLLEVASYRE